jgi:ArsR family transcriptional regulator, arsenate/arsenite/antimonite-responsive transcriptional repressor
MTDAFQALAHPVRREILRLLRKRPMSAGELADAFDLAKPTMSGHFSILKGADLIAQERKGTTILYRLNLSVMEEVLATLMQIAQIGITETGKKRKWVAARR